MADNFLERQHDDYLRRKAKAEAARRAAWQRRLKAYRASLASATGPRGDGRGGVDDNKGDDDEG